jgi:hypothetical protein
VREEDDGLAFEGAANDALVVAELVDDFLAPSVVGLGDLL